MESLPQELVGNIVDRVGDRKTLSSCSTVAMRFVEPCQQRMFRRLNLGHQPSLEARQLCLAASPHIGFYTKDLLVFVPERENEQRALELILHSLPNIARLLVNGHTLRWSQLGEGLKNALQDVIARPFAHTLHILDLDDVSPAFFASAISSVSTLMCSWVHISADDEISGGVSGLLPDSLLRRLILPGSKFAHSMALFCDVLVRTPEYLANLEHLWVAIDAKGVGYDARLLSVVAATLQHLEVSPRGRYLSTPLLESVDLVRMPHLRTPTIHLYIARGFPFSTRFPSAALAKIAFVCPLLESLILTVHIPPEDIHSSWPSREPPVEDDMRFAHLRRVSCRLSPERNADDMDAVSRKPRSAMEELMPALRNTPDILSFECCQPIFIYQF
ncbi:hypothetical protein C8J57DRAFT_1493062 [Mycena rebaudengoi]|nr:hypothetical protein C8J57DRAFT_1493062 [Mycena rebaudengoi]